MSLPNLSDLLTKETVIVNVSVSDYKDAIRKAGNLLVKAGAAEPRYIEAMVKFCELYKAYIVIIPHIAIPHAKPEDGMKRVSFSLITLKNPVYFGHPDNDPVDLVIAFGGSDHSSHLKALAQLAEMLKDQEAVEKIRRAKTKEEVLEVIARF